MYLGELEEKGVHNMSNIVDHSAYDGKVRQAEAQGKEHYGSLFMSRGQSSRVPGDLVECVSPIRECSDGV